MTPNTAKDSTNRERPAERRPLWQRLSLPVLGAGMIVLGAFGVIVPVIPGILLFALGFPLLFAFHQASEDWAIQVIHEWYAALKRLVVWRTTAPGRRKSRAE